MDETRFWSMIEIAWRAAGGAMAERQALVDGDLTHEQGETLLETLDEFLPALRKELNQLSAPDLLEFDRILEKKLFDIDRADIHEHTDGSDDGVLYCRGFIVACGKVYYDAVNAEPSFAEIDLECEAMCYISWHLYNDKFGPIPRSSISRETCRNKAGWPNLL